MSRHKSFITSVHDRELRIVLVLTLLTAVVTAVTNSQVVPGVGFLDAEAGLAVPFGALFGVYGAAAVGLGSLGRATLTGTLTPPAVARTGAYVVVGVVAAAVWRSVSATGAIQSLPGPTRAPRYLLATAAGTAAGGATMGWAFEFLGVSAFFLALGHTVVFAAAALLVGVPAFLLLDRFTMGFHNQRFNVESDRRVLATLLFVPYGWLVFGTVGSIGYRSFDVVFSYDPRLFQTLGVGYLSLVHADSVFGRGAVRAQLLLGGMMVALLTVATLHAFDTTTGGEGAD